MIGRRTHKSAACWIGMGVVYLAIPVALGAASPARISGSISGLVTDSAGIPQMGATVLLFNHQDRLYEKVLTDDKGLFSFFGLFPDLYSIRVSLASFVPAFKRGILVQAGTNSALSVNLANLFSSIQFVYPTVDQRALMNDDWKWVLRTANATRPVLRMLPGTVFDEVGPRSASATNVFSETRGLLRVSAGDGNFAPSTFSGGADMGTAFALATSLYGSNQLEFSGKLGYGAQTGVPSAAFRTSYSRNVGGGSPEISITMRQLFLPGRIGSALNSDSGVAAMRSLSLSYDDRTQLSDSVSLQYGFSLDSVSMLDRLNYFSPYARLNWNLGEAGDLELAYTSGNARPDLASSGGVVREDTELQRDINTLALFPRISRRDGHARVQRGEDFEISYSRSVGSRTFRISGYRESVSNAALTLVAPDGFYASSDILPDLFSGNSIFNAGSYQTLGYQLSMTQKVGENATATVMYGSMGALSADDHALVSNSPDELRSMIRTGRKHAVTAKTNITLPLSGTQVIASYQWSDHRWAAPGHLYSIQSFRPEPGLNIYIRQPIPFGFLPWRMEATADLRNLLAQGYVPLSVSDGGRLLLVQTPRSLRGGLSFIF